MIHPNPDGNIQTPTQRKSRMFDPFDDDFFKEFELRMPTPREPKQDKETEKTKKKKRVVKKV